MLNAMRAQLPMPSQAANSLTQPAYRIQMHLSISAMQGQHTCRGVAGTSLTYRQLTRSQNIPSTERRLMGVVNKSCLFIRGQS